MDIKRVCVVGAGTMGSGIAQTVAQSGYETAMVDVKDELLDRGMSTIKGNLARLVKKETMTQAQVDEIVARIQTTTDLKQAAKDADYVIEAVFEKAEVKQPVLKQLDEACPEKTILATNTSSIPISLLSSAVNRPEKLLGMHFFNPVPVMKLIEVVKSLTTSDETVSISVEFGKSLGKEPVVVKDSPGFVANRIANVAANEALKILEDGLASASDIDKICRLAFNWPIGFLEMIDLVGADVVLDLAETIYNQTGWERYKAAPILRRMVESGYIGRKAGKGFYTLFADK
ncbi:MAG: 3-hydroxybutyryl-CoA dehydrogenase [Chloroflexi bacterium]|nr:MAG: 3-hydroxybutyryl-CoA dehydrogenase [Chloroflexota bacterium]RLC96395.1 MAG: 3-hydroxybutyryl-CoA dehydrogenase [Chloroflexota bacterium]